MIIKQLSIFLENKTGRINELTEILGNANINLSAFSMAENAEFGIMRVIVSDPERAFAILKENRFAVRQTDVVCLSCPNNPGSLSKALKYLSENNILIEYMYAFSAGDIARVVIRPNDIQACIDVLSAHQMDLIDAKQIYEL